MVLCSQLCQASSDEWEEGTFVATEECPKLKFCRVEAIHDFQKLKECAENNMGGGSSANKLGNPVGHRMRQDSVYKACVKGLETIFLFPISTILRQPDYATFLTSLADIITDAVGKYSLAAPLN